MKIMKITSARKEPMAPPGYFSVFAASEKGWCFIKKQNRDQRVSETGEVKIRVHSDGSPRI